MIHFCCQDIGITKSSLARAKGEVRKDIIRQLIATKVDMEDAGYNISSREGKDYFKEFLIKLRSGKVIGDNQ